MAKLPLYAAGIVVTFAILLMAAAAQDDGLLEKAQEIFQPLPKDMATAEFPITRERVELGRQYELFKLSPASVLRDRRATETNGC